MNKFLLQFYLVIIGILLFVGGVLFLLFNHVDTLYTYVPATTENYLHLNPASLRELNAGQKQVIAKWLADHSALTSADWEIIMDIKSRELALYTLNGQIFGITNNTTKNKLYLSIANIKNSEVGLALYFGNWTIGKADLQSLEQTEWFRPLRQKICFKDFVLYSQDLNTLQLNLPALRNTDIPTISFLGKFDDHRILIDILGQVGQNKTQTIKAPLKTLPASAINYFRNLRIEEIAQFNAVSDNLELSIVQKLGSGIEYYKDNAGSQVKTAKDSLTLDQVKKAVLSSLAQLYPSRKERVLPDNTIAINLIADEQAWEFIEFSTGNWILQEKALKTETKLQLNLKETEASYILTFGAPIMSGISTSKCKLPKFSQNGLIYTQTNNQNFRNILIQNKNQNKISICID